MDKLLIVIFIIGLAYAEKECQEGWIKAEGDCYHISKEFLDYFESDEYCKNLDSRLAEFNQDKIPKRLEIAIKEDHLDSCGHRDPICEWWVGSKEHKIDEEWYDSCVELEHTKGNPFKINYITSNEFDRCYINFRPICQKRLFQI